VTRFRTSNFVCLAAIVSLVLICVLPGVSSGHAFPDHSEPRVGSTVSNPPSAVRIWFDGDIEPAFSSIRVSTMDGKIVDKGDGHVDSKDKTLLEVSMPPLAPGTYLVIWNVVARDGHRTTGKYAFTVR
jgi:methionine-rich copper-binding protein CopC